MIASRAPEDLSVLSLRLAVFSNGYSPVLARGKVSDVTGWRTPVQSEQEITELTYANPGYTNTGLLCGSLVAVDIDAPDAETAEGLLAMAEVLPGFEQALKRVGKAPKICLFFRAAEVRKKRATKAYIIRGEKCQVEVMGDGQQVLGFGVHPDTGKPYEWLGASPLDTPFSDLPEIDAHAIDQFIAQAEAYLAATGQPVIKPRAEPTYPEYQPTQQRAPAGDGIWAELKALAMANLGAWVPELGLSGTRTYEQGYLARADFRPSTSSTGKTGSKRGLSICFAPNGIVDYADGNRGYNPIDMASVALGISPSEAADWLRARVGDERPAAQPHQYDGMIAKSRAKHHRPGSASASGRPTKELVAANDNKADLPPTPAMHPDPYNPSAVGGLIGDIARWITSTSVVKFAELSLASSIALMAGIFGSRALTPTDSGVNIYATTIVKTAGGKGRPPNAIRALADRAVPGAVSNGDPTSYAAFERILRKNSSVVTVMDEFGLTLQGVNSKKHDPAAASIRKFLLAIYDQANSSFDGKAYASADTKKDDSPIEGPALTVLAMTTAETLYKGVSRESVTDGFLNRFVFVEATPDPDGIKPPDLRANNSPPARLVADLQKAVTSFPVAAPAPGKSAKVKHRVPFDGGIDSPAHKAWEELFL